MARIMRILILVYGLVNIFMTAQAEDRQDMKFSGTLIVPPSCKINNDDRIDVNFGDRLGINKIDGKNYLQLINYQIDCEEASSNSWMLILSLLGDSSGFDQDALMVANKNNLGIRIYQNGKPFTPGSRLLIDPTDPPTLEAVPVKQIGTTLIEGDFEVYATLQADYY